MVFRVEEYFGVSFTVDVCLPDIYFFDNKA